MINRFYIWILAILLCLAVLLVLLWKPWSTTRKTFEDLLLKDINDVSRIEIRAVFDTLVFNRTDSQWQWQEEILNQMSVENLLIAASELSLKSILVKNDLSKVNFIAELLFYDKKKEVNRFDCAMNNYGFYIFERDAESVYGVELLGFEKYKLESIFSVNPDHYRQHLLIDLLPDEIKSFEIYPLNGDAFIAKQDPEHNISVFNAETEKDITELINEERIRLLFSYFNAIPYLSVIEEEEIEPGTFPSDPIASIFIKTFNDEEWDFEVYSWTKPDEKQADIFEALLIFSEKPELLSVKYFYIDLLMRSLDKYLQ